MGLAPGNVFLTSLLNLIGKRRGDAKRRHLGIRARICREDPCPGLAFGC
jgi:hypothetical protein